MTGALRPAPETALVLVVSLPPALDALRLRSIEDASAGVPAHVTLLYPFAEEAQLDAGTLGLVAAIAARHPVLRLTLGEGRRFPDTLYASVEPDAPLRALQNELAAAFPTLPLYGVSVPICARTERRSPSRSSAWCCSRSQTTRSPSYSPQR